MTNQKETIKLDITDTSDMGQGIGRLDNIVVFVDGALPGDKVLAEITQKKKKFIKARTVEIIHPSPDRTESICPYTVKCGGCAFMGFSYPAELELKVDHLKEKLKRIGEITDYECEPAIYMDEPYHYRNKTEFAVSKSGAVGFNQIGTNNIVDIPECYISSFVANEVSKIIRLYTGKNGLGIRKATVRSSFSTGETMVIFHTSSSGNAGANEEKFYPLIEDMDDAINDLASRSDSPDDPDFSLESVYLYDENKKKNSYSLIAGKKTIDDGLSGLKFEISPGSFYQTNPIQTEKLYAKVKEFASPTGSENILDLYCGVGTIGLALSDSAKSVIGVESVKDAILDANRNAVINGIVNATFIHGKAEEMMEELPIEEGSVIILDPPRAGCKPQVLDAIGTSKSNKIVYVSCDPGTFARDIKILGDYGFSLKKITPIDMFPRTNHLEIISLITR